MEFEEDLVAPTACLFFSEKKVPMMTSSPECQTFLALRRKKGKKHLQTMAKINPVILPLMRFVLRVVSTRGYQKTEKALEEMIKDATQ